jgi:hypothetical protein
MSFQNPQIFQQTIASVVFFEKISKNSKKIIIIS